MRKDYSSVETVCTVNNLTKAAVKAMTENAIAGNHNVQVSLQFNDIVNRIKVLIREYRHQVDNSRMAEELSNFSRFLDDVNFKIDWVDDSETYVKGKMLDAMDHIMDNWFGKYSAGSVTEKTVHTIYDTIHDFYFGVEA